MTCSRCGADAAIKRDNAYYCGRCAVARDWGEIIALVQDGPRQSDRVLFDDPDTATDTTVSSAHAADPFGA